METFSALLAICAGNSPVPGEFPTQRPVTRSFDVSTRINGWVNNGEAGDFSRYRGHYDVTVMEMIICYDGGWRSWSWWIKWWRLKNHWYIFMGVLFDNNSIGMIMRRDCLFFPQYSQDWLRSLYKVIKLIDRMIFQIHRVSVQHVLTLWSLQSCCNSPDNISGVLGTFLRIFYRIGSLLSEANLRNIDINHVSWQTFSY